jgi:hypothetical protein
MNEQPSKPSIKDNVLKVIESGRIKMRPKWQFVTQTVLLIVGTVLIALTTLYLGSFIVFVLRQNGAWFTPGFGFRGFGIFFSSLPLVLLALSLVFMILLEILVRRYSFAYSRPFLYSALGVILLVTIGGVVIGYTSLHQRLFDESENGHIPFGRPFYRQFTEPRGDVTVGTITEITNNGCKISGPRDEIFSVIVNDQTQLPPDNNLNVGDNIVILGPREGSTISALGIQKPGFLPPPHHYHHSQPEFN